MKLYTHWVKLEAKIKIGNREQNTLVYGASNQSPEEAQQKATAKLKWIQEKILGTATTDETYEVAIREEIVHRLDEHNVITRNRYGSLVLNSEKMLILDIDQAPTSFWNLIRGQVGKKWHKPKILNLINKKIKNYPHLSFRVYETPKGYRAIVTGKDFLGAGTEAQNIMKDFNVDDLYSLLCGKQNCFRARLSPKPHRIKLPSPKLLFPRSPSEENTFKLWLKNYEEKAERYSSCRFVFAAGNSIKNPAIEYHDRMSKATSSLPMA